MKDIADSHQSDNSATAERGAFSESLAAAALDFLETVVGRDGRAAISWTEPDARAWRSKVGDLPRARALIAEHLRDLDGKANVYFVANETKAKEEWTCKPNAAGKATKPNKVDISRVRLLWVDIDPKDGPDGATYSEERKRLLELAKEWAARPNGPFAIVDSGNGVQMFWRLAEPLDATTENVAAAEAQGKALARRFGGDAVQNVDRVMRVPGLVNLPDEGKRAKGRVPRRGRLLHLDRERVCTLDDLAAIATPRPDDARTDGGSALEGFDWSAVEEAAVGGEDVLPPHLRKIVDANRATIERIGDNHSGDRSTGDHALACHFIRQGVQDPTEIGMITFAVASPADKSETKAVEHGAGYARRTIAEALRAVAREPEDFLRPIADADWPDPVDLFDDANPADLAEVPEGCLPDCIARWVATEAPRKGCTPMLAAASAVAVAGAAIGNALRLQPRLHDTASTVPASLWVMLIADPGVGKSPMIGAALDPLRRVETQWARETKALATLAAEDNCEKGEAKGAPRKKRAAPRLIVDNATMERLISLLAENPRGMISAPDEFVGLLGSLGAYKTGQSGDRGQLLRLFDGGPIVVDRVKTPEAIRAGSALLGILAGTQPDKISRLAVDLGSDGLLQRCLFISDDGAARRTVDAAPDKAASDEFAATIRSLANLGAAGAVVRLSPEAREILSSVLDMTETLKASPGEGPAWRGHLGKWEGILGRITLIFHAVDQAGGLFEAVDPAVPISAETAHMAARFSSLLLRHSLHFHHTYLGETQDASEARSLAGYLLAQKLERISRRDVGQARRDLRNPRTRNAVMRELEHTGWVLPDGKDAEGPLAWRINPKIHTRFSERADREKSNREEKHRQIKKAVAARRRLNGQDGRADA